MAKNTEKTPAQIAREAELDAQIKIRAYAGKSCEVTTDLVVDVQDKTTLRPHKDTDPASAVVVIPAGTKGVTVQYVGPADASKATFYVVQLLWNDKLTGPQMKYLAAPVKIVAGAVAVAAPKRASYTSTTESREKLPAERAAEEAVAAYLEAAETEDGPTLAQLVDATRKCALADLALLDHFAATQNVDVLHWVTQSGWGRHRVLRDSGEEKRAWAKPRHSKGYMEGESDPDYDQWVARVDALRTQLGSK